MNSGSSCVAGPDVAVPCGAVPGCAVVKADVPPCAMGDSLLTGSNEIGFAFGEALAPDSDGLAKPIAVERRGACRGRRFGPRNERWQCG